MGGWEYPNAEPRGCLPAGVGFVLEGDLCLRNSQAERGADAEGGREQQCPASSGAGGKPFLWQGRRQNVLLAQLPGDNLGLFLSWEWGFFSQSVRFCGEVAPGVESFPGFFPLPWAGVSLAVLEVHVGTSLVFSVEGQRAVLPVWYTSHSHKEPYITWMLNKKPAPFQVRRGQGLQDGRWRGPSWSVTMEGVMVVPMMGGRLWCPPWGSGHSACGGQMPMMMRWP